MGIAASVVLEATCSLPPRQPPPPQRPSDTFPEAQLVQDPAGHTYLVAIERAPEGERVAIVASPDFGASWDTPRALAGGALAARRQVSVAVGAANEVYIVWVETRQGPDGVYFDRSLDGGSTWLAEPVRLIEGASAGSHLASPRLLSDDHGDVYLLWWDDREGFDALYATRSRDRGSSWLFQPQRITSLTFGAKALVRAACDRDGTVYVTWSEWVDGVWRLRANVSTDYAETWDLRELYVSSGRNVVAADLGALDGGVALAAWVEAGAAGSRIYASRSHDRGRSWEPPHQLGSALIGTPSPPRIVPVEPSQIDIAWKVRNPAGEDRVVLARSRDAGARFVERVLDRRAPVGPGVLALEPPPSEVPFGFAADASGNGYFVWVEPAIGTLGLHFERVTDTTPDWTQPHSDLDLEVRTETLLDSARWVLQVPQVVSDDFGRVCVLWNVGYSIQVAASPFYGESGWQHREF
jgi:BNR repeat-like domain